MKCMYVAYNLASNQTCRGYRPLPLKKIAVTSGTVPLDRSRGLAALAVSLEKFDSGISYFLGVKVAILE